MSIRMKTKILFLQFILLFFFISVHAQIITIVADPSGEPIENVALFNSLKSIAALSEKNGSANISNFLETDSIFFQHPAYNMEVFLKKDLDNVKRVILSRKIVLIDEFVISASKYRENKREVAFKVDVLEEEALIRFQEQSSADILLSTGNVLVQKSQGGGGSPILRGFEANKILLVVDGVRMNNAIYRSGHLQNSITIDNAMLERVEIVYGPTSILYGSDALGGIIHYYTRDPLLSDGSRKNNFSVRANTQYSSANHGKTFHLSLNNGFKKLGFLTGISHKDLGDINIGQRSNPFYEDFGKLFHYAETINGIDSTITNPDPYRMQNTGYSQTDIIQKIKFSPSQNTDFILNLQYSSSSEIDRLDELNDYRGVNMNYAEYYYGPQNRFLASIKTVVKSSTPVFSGMTATLAYQRIDEDRISRRFRNPNKLFQEEDVQVYTLNVDFNKMNVNKSRFFYGLEASANEVLSTAWYQNIVTGSTYPTQTRYPDGGSNTWSAAAYGKYRWIPNDKIVLTSGLRYQYGSLKSVFNQGFIPEPEVSINNGALTGSLSMVYHPGNKWQISTIASTGFRNPNVDDYGKVRAKDNLVTVPNPSLKPEYTWNAEAGISKTIEGYIRLSGTVWYSYLTNAITRTDYRVNGLDSMLYDGELYKIITNSNAGEAYIRGISFGLVSDLNSSFLINSTLNLTEGWNITEDEPMSHIPPIFGRTTISYIAKEDLLLDIYMDYNGWKRLEKMSTMGEDNTEEGTIHGFPSWSTINFRTSYRLTPEIRVQFAIENIFDRMYKPFASAVPGIGRNFIIALKAEI
jgi:hemoglobin/transferrin/lactoferrin receptor protein